MNQDKPKRDVSLPPRSMQPAEYERTIYVARVEHGVTMDDILNPKFWAHVAQKLRPRDRIEVEFEDGSSFVELRVMSCDRTWARVVPLAVVPLTGEKSQPSKEAAAAIRDDYEVRLRGPRKYCVVRKSDNSPVKEDCQTREEAELWLNNHLQALGVPKAA